MLKYVKRDDDYDDFDDDYGEFDGNYHDFDDKFGNFDGHYDVFCGDPSPLPRHHKKMFSLFMSW